MNSTASTLEPLFHFISYSVVSLESAFNSIPGSAVIARYVRSSHQNDPVRTVLEVILIILAIVILVQTRTRSDASGKHFIKFNKQEIDDLVDEWIPEPLVPSLSQEEEAALESIPVIEGPSGPRPKLLKTGQTVLNLASFNFIGLAGNAEIQERAVETLRKYGLGSCGPPNFYGTADVHMQLERDIASFLGTESAIIYSQAFSTISAVIPAYCKRGDIIVADKAVNFAIHKGLQISRSTVRWFEHNDMKSLEAVLKQVERERQKKRGRLTRRFIVTEGLFENDGTMPNLPKIVELKKKYKYRLVLDETFSIGTVGKTGRGITEHFKVPVTDIDMLVGSLAHSFCSVGGFCTGTKIVVDHQRINGTSFVFSAAMPPLAAKASSEGISLLEKTPSMLTALQDNIFAARQVLHTMDAIEVVSHPVSPIIHIFLRQRSQLLHPSYFVLGNGYHDKHVPSEDIYQSSMFAAQEKTLQSVVEDALEHGVLITRARRLHGQESPEPRPSIRLAISSALTKAEVERAVGVVYESLRKHLS